MPISKRELDPEKLFDRGKIRANLMLCSLYLTAFELLKSAIIDGIADWIVWELNTKSDYDRIQEELETRLREAGLSSQEMSDFLGNPEDSRNTRDDQIDLYEQEIGTKFEKRDRFGLIPSCKWLCDLGVLTKMDIDDIKAIRKHRNLIAHELPDLLTRKGLEIDLGHLCRIRETLAKVEVFWAKENISIEHPDVYELPDENIFLGKVYLMDQVLQTVLDSIE